MDLNPNLLARIASIDWFSHCGEPLSIPVSMRVQTLSTWERAIQCYHDPDWEDTTLEAQNELTGFLHVYYCAEYQKWNKIVIVANEFMKEAVTPNLVAFQQAKQLDEDFLHTVHWDILGAIMEDYYRYCNHPVDFFTQLLSIYEAGHFPCGWDGGTWPRGWLIVL